MSKGKVQESMYCPVSQSHEMTLESRDWQFGVKTSRFRDFCQFFEGFSLGFRKFGLGKKSQFRFRKIWSRKKSLGFGKFGHEKKYWFRRIWSRKKVSVSENLVSKKVSVSENLISEKKSWFRFQRIWSREKRLGFGYRKFGLGKKGLFRKIWHQKKSLGYSQKFVNVIQCSGWHKCPDPSSVFLNK